MKKGEIKFAEVKTFTELYDLSAEQLGYLDSAEKEGTMHPYAILAAKCNLFLAMQGATLRLLAEAEAKPKLVLPGMLS